MAFTSDLSGIWRFKPGGGEWTQIKVPSFWEAAGHLDLDGVATYEREIELEGVSWATLEFDAVADLCRVFLNDDLVGSHEVGFTPFVIDVSGLLTDGTNTIRVEVEDPAEGTPLHLNTIQGKQGWANRFFRSPPSLYLTYGGIWQPCRLVAHGPVYLSDLWCDMNPIEPTIRFTAENRSSEDLEAVVIVRAFGGAESAVLAIKAGSSSNGVVRFPGHGLARWSPETPHLYEITASAEVAGEVSHEQTLKTGLRTFERIDDDFLLNGKPYRMRSALHQGFWPRGLYALDEELAERDVRLAREVGFNTLRTHLKSFEPKWLNEADRAGLLLHCDLPIGEPLEDKSVSPQTDFGRRCLSAAFEQVKRDRSRPSIIMWTLMNEVGLHREDLLRSPGYIELARELGRVVGELDPARPAIENDWVESSDLLYSSDLRSPHWYGRATSGFATELNDHLRDTEGGHGPLFVTEFGEWGLPMQESGAEFWDNEKELARIVAEAGWPRDYDSFAQASQRHQGWADRLHAEQLRTAPHVLGFCLTEWTDVPHEMNGLISLRRNPKEAAIEAFRTALADVAPIAVLDRYAFAAGETVEMRLFLSNWSQEDLAATKIQASLGEEFFAAEVPPVLAGTVVSVGEVTLRVPAGVKELVLDWEGACTIYPVSVFEDPMPFVVEVTGSDSLAAALGSVSGAEVLVATGPFNLEKTARLEREVESGRRVILLADQGSLPFFGETEAIPTAWGPTPFLFGDGSIFEGFLGPEVYHCFPKAAIPFLRGPVGVVVAPPIGRWGSVVAVSSFGAGRAAACLLPLGWGLKNGRGFERHLLSELARLVEEED